MNSPINYSVILPWVAGIGGPNKAAPIIAEALGCSLDIGLKIARGKYHSLPMPPGQKALAERVGKPVHILFKPPRRARMQGGVAKNRTA